MLHGWGTLILEVSGDPFELLILLLNNTESKTDQVRVTYTVQR